MYRSAFQRSAGPALAPAPASPSLPREMRTGPRLSLVSSSSGSPFVVGIPLNYWVFQAKGWVEYLFAGVGHSCVSTKPSKRPAPSLINASVTSLGYHLLLSVFT